VSLLLEADGRSVARSEKTSATMDPQFLRRVRAELAKP
jgi:hypothetical protein